MKQEQRFSEIEYCLQRYFDANITTVMAAVRHDLTEKQVAELQQYDSSFAGLVQAGTNPYATGYDSKRMMMAVGEWNSKTAEDYLQMCSERIVQSKACQSDLALLSAEWRKTMVAEIGRERYDELSSQLGGDLAYAYIDYRVQQMMIDRLVRERTPDSTMEYIFSKGSEGSIIGLGNALNHSPLETEIGEAAEAAYRPSMKETTAGRAVSFGFDIITTGGVSSWAALARLAGVEVIFAGIEQKIKNEAKANKPITVEDCISRGVFHSTQNVFADFRSSAQNIKSYENSYVQYINGRLAQPMRIPLKKPMEFEEIIDQTAPPQWESPVHIEPHTEAKRDAKYQEVPMMIAPGKEEEYIEEHKPRTAAPAPTSVKEAEPQTVEQASVQPSVERESEAVTPTNTDGWNGLLSSVGLNGFGDITRNLGYVISMLPDLFFGMFTGKTDMRVKDNLMPIASVLLGLFVRNPLLKMVLIGMGGANLLNKAGHEALGKHAASEAPQQSVRYKRYADEPLNPRIQSPALQGGNLIAIIDQVPCSIKLPDSVVAACQEGALPINTLANAVLTRHEQMQTVAQQSYDASQQEQQVVIQRR